MQGISSIIGKKHNMSIKNINLPADTNYIKQQLEETISKVNRYSMRITRLQDLLSAEEEKIRNCLIEERRLKKALNESFNN